MMKKRRRTGLPAERLPSFMRPEESDIAGRIASEPDRFVRVRNGLLVVVAIFACFVAFLAFTDRGGAASGLAALILAPLVLVLIGAQGILMVARRTGDPTRRQR